MNRSSASPPQPFSGLRRLVENDFMLNFYAGVFCLLDYLRTLDSDSEDPLSDALGRYPFLQSYLDAMWRYLPDDLTWATGVTWWRRAIEEWERPRRGHLPLAALAVHTEVGFARRMGLVACCLIEEDARFTSLFRDLNRPVDGPRPGLELIGRLILHVEPDLAPSPWDACEPLIERGLCLADDPDSPHSQWQLRVPDLIWRTLRRQVTRQPTASLECQSRFQAPALKGLIFDPEVGAELAALPSVIRAHRVRAVTMRGSAGSDRLRAISAVARALRMDTIRVTESAIRSEEVARQLGTLCLMARAMPVLRFDLAPGESRPIPELPGFEGPLGILLGEDGGVDAPRDGEVVAISLPFPGPDERRRHWIQAFADHPVAGLERIVERHLIPAGLIRQAAAGAIAQAALQRRQQVQPEDVRKASRALNRQLLDNLADPMDCEGGWELVATSAPTGAKLDELERRCRAREALGAHLGIAFGRRFNRGVRALFNGPSGTGKTLAARALAYQLGMDLYRVDLASVVNKYIGETEKNLNRVLSRAEELDVILLLDEGDALMGKRTDVQSANDRYANLETNYLLQRIESHQGIILITTNAGEYIDKAFERRMDVAVTFNEPDAVLREQIWQLHLPAAHEVPPDWLAAISRRAALTGGQIRNAALLATLLAVDAGDGVVRRVHLEKAVESEYRKAGAVSPVREVVPPPGRRRGADVRDFFRLI